MKSIQDVIKESTCQKRVTVCELYNYTWGLLSRESNRCNPEGGTCHRIGVVQTKTNYDKESSCNWTHAEIMALNALPKNQTPYRAIIYGHSFVCENCEKALRKAGVKQIKIMSEIPKL